MIDKNRIDSIHKDLSAVLAIESGFSAMKDGDLILCVNLLHADAREYEQMSDNPNDQPLLQARAADRRALAARMKAEVDRRVEERWGQLS
jgi:hypothetical protein